jgi:hypothetical protein
MRFIPVALVVGYQVAWTFCTVAAFVCVPPAARLAVLGWWLGSVAALLVGALIKYLFSY